MSASASDFAVSASANMRPPSQKPDDCQVLARLTTEFSFAARTLMHENGALGASWILISGEGLKELDVVAVGDQRKLLTVIADLACPSTPFSPISAIRERTRTTPSGRCAGLAIAEAVSKISAPDGSPLAVRIGVSTASSSSEICSVPENRTSEASSATRRISRRDSRGSQSPAESSSPRLPAG